MKKTSLILLFIVFSISSYAQSDNWYFSFSMGGSWPSGTFGQSTTSDNKSGYAQKGFSILLDATYPVSNHFGLKGLALINTSSIDNNGMETMLKNRISSAIVIADPKYLSYTSNPWMWNAFLVGPSYTITLGRLYWDLQLLGGMNLTYLPQQKLQYNPYNADQTNPNKWYYSDQNTSSTNLGMGFLAGTAFRFPLSERLNLKVGANYYFSSAKVKYQQTRISQQAETAVTEVLGSGNYSIPIKMITGTIGFVYYLN